MTGLLTLWAADQAFQRIRTMPDAGVPTMPGGAVVHSIAMGMTLANVEWTTDRGNAMWDGACVVLEVMGIDTKAPL